MNKMNNVEENEFNNLTKEGFELFDLVTTLNLNYDGKEVTIYEICTETKDQSIDIYRKNLKKINKINKETNRVEYTRATLDDYRYVYKNNHIVNTHVVTIDFKNNLKLKNRQRSISEINITYLIPKEAAKYIISGVELREALIANKVIENGLVKYISKEDFENYDKVVEEINMNYFYAYNNSPITENEEFYVTDNARIVYLHGDMRNVEKTFKLSTFKSLLRNNERMRKSIDWDTAVYLNEWEVKSSKHDRALTGDFLMIYFNNDYKEAMEFLQSKLKVIEIRDRIQEFSDLKFEDFKDSYYINFIKNGKDTHILIKNYRYLWKVVNKILAQEKGKILFESEVNSHVEYDHLCDLKDRTIINSANVEVITHNKDTNKEERYNFKLKLSSGESPSVELYYELKGLNVGNINDTIIINANVSLCNDVYDIEEYSNYRLPVIFDLNTNQYVLDLNSTGVIWK